MSLWNRITKFFSGEAKPQPQRAGDMPEVGWLADDQNRWGVPVLDVRPVTQTMLCATGDPAVAEKFGQMQGEDGVALCREQPSIARTIDADLQYRVDGPLPPGVLFAPKEMEDKWGIYHHEGRLLFVRSWLRKVLVTAETRISDGLLHVGPIHGSILNNDQEEPRFTIRAIDWLLRTLVLGTVWPAPLPNDLDLPRKTIAMWCLSTFGRAALLATSHDLSAAIPERPLRVHSLLHIAVARADHAAIEKQLAAGLRFDSLAGDGLTAVHWARDEKILAFLLDHGAPVDVRSAEGATPLMQGVQARSMLQVRLLVDRGADVNARDARGFTALHRAAEMGEVEMVKLFLARGAERAPEAQGQTPRSLAEKRGEKEVVSLLGERDA